MQAEGKVAENSAEPHFLGLWPLTTPEDSVAHLTSVLSRGRNVVVTAVRRTKYIFVYMKGDADQVSQVTMRFDMISPRDFA